MQELNIVELIENNPLSKLSNSYNSKLLNKIKENFTGYEQQLFVSSFYCYLNYDKNMDFMVDMDDIWKWLGFSTKQHLERVLEKHFVNDIDYKKTALSANKASLYKETVSQLGEAVLEDEPSLTNLGKQSIKHEKGGQNIKKIMLNIRCFKSLCLKSQTKKASQIHEYYIKMEEILQETLEEETDELKLQLEQKDQQLEQKEQEKEKIISSSKKEKQRAVEQAIIIQFPLNIECIYFGTIENTNEKGEKLIKFGHTNDLNTRVLDHHKKYNNFILVGAFRVQNKVEIENLIKNNPKIKNHIRSIEVNGKNKVEILAYDETNFTIPRLTKYIKDIIHEATYNIENYNKIIKQNGELVNEVRELKNENRILEIKNEKQELELIELRETVEKQLKSITSVENETQIITQPHQQNPLLEDDNLTQRFNEFISTCCIIRKDVEVDSCEILASFRIWNKVKPTRETNERFTIYLKTRFIAARLQNQDKNQVVHGFQGVMMKPIEYKKRLINDITEQFIFENCNFSPNNRILNTKLCKEYVNYKKKLGISMTETEMEELKKYLNSCQYTQKGTIWVQELKLSNEGYWGIGLKTDTPLIRKMTSVTGKKVERVDNKTGLVVNTWETIAKAAVYEKISATKMSLSIKNKTVFVDYYYRVSI
jgi:hypothetical protein